MTVDWAEALTRAKRNAGDWVLAGERVPRSALGTARRRSNLTLRALEHPLEARMTKLVDGRGDLYICYLGPAEKEQREAAFFRTVVVPVALKERVQAHATTQGVTITSLVEGVCRRIARNGHSRPAEPSTTLNLTVDQGVWERALRRAEEDGFVLAEAIREELEGLIQKG